MLYDIKDGGKNSWQYRSPLLIAAITHSWFSKRCQTSIRHPKRRQFARLKELIKQVLASLLPLSGRHIGHFGILLIGCCGEGNTTPTGLSASFHGTCGIDGNELAACSWGFAFLLYIPRVSRSFDVAWASLIWRLAVNLIGFANIVWVHHDFCIDSDNSPSR